MSVASRELVKQLVTTISPLTDAEVEACLADLRFIPCKTGSMFIREGAVKHEIGICINQ